MFIKNFLLYMKYHVKWFFAVLFCGLMMSAVMILNHISCQEILYGMLLCIVIFAAIMTADFYSYSRRYKKLKELEHSVTVSLNGMEETDEPLHQEYQTLIKKLFAENARLANESVHREQDLMEYYTMWVHQIKTPIAALKLLLEETDEESGSIPAGKNEQERNNNLQQQLYKEAKQNEELQELFRIEQYVEMALHYMRLGSETTDFVIKTVQLDAVIREAIHKYAKQFVQKKIRLNYEAVKKEAVTDEKWLEFVIEQILSNAIKYTPKGSISIYMEEMTLVISDTGIGIRQEDLPRVCEKGYTGYNGHADKRSTGIGLYLCSRILKKLGHTLTITSKEGEGTRVAIGFADDGSKY